VFQLHFLFPIGLRLMPNKTSLDPYSILGLTSDATDEEIQVAFRKALRRFHPDKYRISDGAQRTAEVVDAHRLIGKAGARSIYDAMSNTKDGGSCEPSVSVDRSGSAVPPKLASVSPSRRNTKLVVAFACAALLIWIADPFTVSGDKELKGPKAILPQAAEGSAQDAVAEYPTLNSGEAQKASAEASPLVDNESTSAALPDTAEPVSYGIAESASNLLVRILQKSGISGARAASEGCHTSQRKRPTWGGSDFCAAFDFAAATLDRGVASDGGSPDPYFAFQARDQSSYYGAKSSEVTLRLRDIEYAANGALKVAIERMDASRTTSLATEQPTSEGAEFDTDTTNAGEPNSNLPTDTATVEGAQSGPAPGSRTNSGN
jgi:hypothetical protein